MKFTLPLSSLLLWLSSTTPAQAFVLPTPKSSLGVASPFQLSMAIDVGMESRLDGIRRSYSALTERLADPDVIADSKLLQKIMSDRAQIEEVVLAYEDYCRLKEELSGAKELFQEAGDDPDMKEMARAEIKEIEVQLDELEDKMKILLLPKDPNDDRNIMLEIRAGTGGSEASIFAGRFDCIFQTSIVHR